MDGMKVLSRKVLLANNEAIIYATSKELSHYEGGEPCPCLMGLATEKTLPDSLLSLGFPNFWLHIPLGQDISNSSTYNSPLELLSAAGALLLNILLLPLLVFAPEGN